MKRTTLFITISSLALLVVLIIQVNWILETAKVKEQMFNEKANMVLARTTEALLSDKTTTKNMQGCMGKKENRTIDSLFTFYMNFYNFHVDYKFEVVQPAVDPFADASGFLNTVNDDQQGCYQKSLNEVADKSGLELKLIFPEKKQFILAEMGPLFITSLVLILVVLLLFWRTSSSLIKEKKIAEHTTDFLNNMTHEFKTPLTNISLAGKMMIKDSASGQEEKIKHYSGIILEENEKLKLQVEQVLSMTALERGEIPLQKIEVDLHQLILTAAKSMSLQIENRSGSLTLDLAAERIVVMGDRIHLLNAICNLIDNAIKYSSGPPELTLQTKDKGDCLIFTVSDRGIGIEKEYQKKVFDKFFRVPTGDLHEVKGFGLGLAYIKKIVELHLGTIDLESEKGKTTFIITLPHV